MFIKKLILNHFRNYSHLEVEFTSFNNYITGSNAIGKTNILEAIHYLSCGRSFKKAADSELIQYGEKEASIYIVFHTDTDDSDHSLSAQIGQNYKIFAYDDEKVKTLSSILGKLLITYYEPSQVFFFKDEPAERRKLLDETLSQLSPKYLFAISRYKKLLKERNAALVQEYDPDVIDVLRNQLINLAYRIVIERINFVKDLINPVNQIYNSLFGEACTLQLKYKTNCPIEPEQKIFVEKALSLFESNKSLENIRKQTLIGPHRDDLTAILNNKTLAGFASQGENRLASLSLKIAIRHYLSKKLSDEPILLLDDVTSDLDAKRCQNLLTHIRTGQTFVTGTRITDEFSKYAVYEADGTQLIRRKENVN